MDCVECIFFYGIGVSQFVVEDLVYKFLCVGWNVYVFVDLYEVVVVMVLFVVGIVVIGFLYIGFMVEIV